MTYPRNNRYEIFTFNNKIYCFDDPSFDQIPASNEIYAWIRKQNKDLWEPMGDDPKSNVALYLKPKLYTMFKLKWGSVI